MNNTNNYQKVMSIHDQVMGLLRSMQISPYPAHYKKYFDELFLQLADAELRKEQEDAEHQIMITSKDDGTKHLDIAKRSVMSFVESHADIASVAKKQQEQLDNAPISTEEEHITFIESLNSLNKDMSGELDKAQSKIIELTTDLNEAFSSLTIDPITKVGNRKGFVEDMGSVIEAGKNKNISMVLMMFDVDNFKFINDEHGYVAGDKVLYFIAQTIKSMIRDADKVYRYGGEEFAVVLTRCDVTQAFALADKIRAKIETSNLLYLGKSVHVTISAGVTIHQQADTFDGIIARAEKALYCAKKSNKNCTILFDW
ncbi:MAG: GGDEF domain-containing protein [Sulfuricurvum sp.]|uniref:GGDEF domain-containing protein n=1 Tax=Sulfuricurvum sp. TaxID=2025608 RepID=UPI0026341974|nr:GGDEF domain-containing protein [Sulfuricurvum sp.]MDD5159727.1 GGDEF domain-containing protein [Sulfuricurvum sp.]